MKRVEATREAAREARETWNKIPWIEESKQTKMERKKRKGKKRRGVREEKMEEEEDDVQRDSKEEKTSRVNLWWYANPEGFFGEKNVQGPFETKLMRVWWKFNYFDSNFIMKRGRKSPWYLYDEIDTEMFKEVEEGKEKWYLADLRHSDGPVGTQVMRFHIDQKNLNPTCFVRCGESGSFQRVRDLKFGMDHFHHLGQDLNTFMDMLRDRYDGKDEGHSSSDSEEGERDDDYDGVDIMKKDVMSKATDSQACVVS